MGFYEGKKVLVTGGRGLVGSNIIIKLKELGAIVSSPTHGELDLTKMESCKKAVKNMDIVFHCAAVSLGAKVMKEDPKRLITPNLLMNSQMLEASVEAGVKQFLFISSNVVYPLLNHAIKENEVSGDFYEVYRGAADTKYYGEKLCEFYNKNYPIKVSVVRPANIYGPRDKFIEEGHVIPALIERAVKRENPFLVWGDGTNIKDFIYVDDFINLILEVVERGFTEPINIGSGVGISLNEIIKKIHNLTGYNGEIKYDLTKPNAIPFRILDITKQNELLNYKSKFGIEGGLKKTIEWYNSLLREITKDELIDFEKEIISIYETGAIRGAVHLSGGNEEELIEIFKNIKQKDWVFSNHRSHYHAILKSKDKNWVRSEILAGNSLHINSRKYKIYTSAIVGGQIPIALGTALAIKRKNGSERVYCFLGDMAAEMGAFNESLRYARGHDLPITFIIEDNELGVYTPTKEAWGKKSEHLEDNKLIYYKYKGIYPHHGIGKWVTF